MKTDINGTSQCPNGQENYEFFTLKLGRKTFKRVQYDYRTKSGELFSCEGNSLNHCRTLKDKWLNR